MTMKLSLLSYQHRGTNIRPVSPLRRITMMTRLRIVAFLFLAMELVVLSLVYRVHLREGEEYDNRQVAATTSTLSPARASLSYFVKRRKTTNELDMAVSMSAQAIESKKNENLMTSASFANKSNKIMSSTITTTTTRTTTVTNEHSSLSLSSSVQKPNLEKDAANTVIVLAGLVLSTKDIRQSTWKFLTHLSCHFGVIIHITAAEVIVGIMDAYQKLRKDRYPNAACGAIHIELQQDLMPSNEQLSSNRILRLARIRDVQRERIRELSYSISSKPNGVVMVADLDLLKFPSPSDIMEDAAWIMNKSTEKLNRPASSGTTMDPHVICGTGVSAARLPELYLYDTFAMVFWPDTFAHPLQRRLIPKFYAEEDPGRVRSNDPINGNFTQGHMMDYLQALAKGREDGLAPVRSCFGGLALYRASTWLTPLCRYENHPNSGNDDPQDERAKLMRYASRAEGQSCEHVVFHDCLYRKVFTDKEPHVAIDPELLLLWRKG